MTNVLGIDIGSAFSKGIISRDQKVLASISIPSGADYKLSADKVKKWLLSKTGLSSNDIDFTVATGYGSKTVEFADHIVTDISCHSKGIAFLFPSVRTVIDVGDLYSKAFRIDEKGNLLNFLLSGKCAGGSGRMLTVIAKILHTNVEDIGDLSLKSRKRVDFGTGCVVFAESEAVSRVAEGVAKEDLLAGIHRALSGQLKGLAVRIGIEKDFALVGGGAKDKGLIQAMQEAMDFDIIVPPEPQLTAALGAAIIAAKMSKSEG